MEKRRLSGVTAVVSTMNIPRVAPRYGALGIGAGTIHGLA
jgi:hypothetical protein